jgi:hypothetical protein
MELQLRDFEGDEVTIQRECRVVLQWDQGSIEGMVRGSLLRFEETAVVRSENGDTILRGALIGNQFVDAEAMSGRWFSYRHPETGAATDDEGNSP